MMDRVLLVVGLLGCVVCDHRRKDSAVQDPIVDTSDGLKFGISAKGRTVLRLSHGSLRPEQFEAARRVWFV